MTYKLEEEVTVKREVTGIIRDLVMFVRSLRDEGYIDEIPNDVERAREYWDREHGE